MGGCFNPPVPFVSTRPDYASGFRNRAGAAAPRQTARGARTCLRLSLCAWILLPWFASAAATSPPLPIREFRGAWVATVSNIDWPSKPGLPAKEQQTELIAILDRARLLKLNAIILQVRPACDALYPSALEPWSEYLTGVMGRPPSPRYDPLAFALKECRKRGLELHAWFNPFRVRHPSGKSAPALNHISRTQPGLVKPYGAYQWLDPGERRSQAHTMNVILDVVRRYDIDGVHLDDYFYPYQKKDGQGRIIDFPDTASWRAYQNAGGKLDRNERRRQTINHFIRTLYANVKREKPWVRVGISPFGIWRPGHPKPIRGMDTYEQIYTDSRKWLREGWLDYCAPQLYWPIQPPAQSYRLLLDWWTEQNAAGRHIWPGLASHKAGAQYPPSEIPSQITLARANRGVSGHLHYNMSGLMENQTLISSIHNRVYQEVALPPAATWLDSSPPEQPSLRRAHADGSGGVELSWKERRGTERAARWLFQTRAGSTWTTQILPGSVHEHFLSPDAAAAIDQVAVTAVDRCANLGLPTVITLRR